MVEVKYMNMGFYSSFTTVSPLQELCLDKGYNIVWIKILVYVSAQIWSKIQNKPIFRSNVRILTDFSFILALCNRGVNLRAQFFHFRVPTMPEMNATALDALRSRLKTATIYAPESEGYKDVLVRWSNTGMKYAVRKEHKT